MTALPNLNNSLLRFNTLQWRPGPREIPGALIPPPFPVMLYTVEIATTGVTAGSQRCNQTGLAPNTTYFSGSGPKTMSAGAALSNGATASALANPVTGAQVLQCVLHQRGG